MSKLLPLIALLSLPSLLLGGCTLDHDSGRGGGGYYGEVDADPWIANDASPGPDSSQVPPDAGAPWPVPDAGGPSPRPDAAPWPEPDAGPPLMPDAGPVADCGAITSEAICTVTNGCRALYVGIDCRCYADGSCECDSWAFDRCE